MANHIAKYAKSEGINTAELAQRLGVSAPYASMLRNGKRAISVKAARRLAALTGKPWHRYVSGGAEQ